MGEVTCGGRKPVNPIGTCYDATAHNFVAEPREWSSQAVICHGIGIANHPEIYGQVITHAWIEDVKDNERLAFDCIWGFVVPVKKYREDAQLNYVVEYTIEQFKFLWALHDYPGPFDEKIFALTPP